MEKRVNWESKNIYWDRQLKQDWQAVADQLAAEGAHHHTLPFTDAALPPDLIIAPADAEVDYACTPVLRPKKEEEYICCDVIHSADNVTEILTRLEKWAEVSTMARNRQLDHLPVLDPEVIDSLHRLAGWEVLWVGRSKFLRSATKYIGRIEKYKNEGNLEEVTKVLHTLKGSSGTIGARQLSQASKLWEERLEEDQDLDEFENQLSLLKMLLEYFRHRSIEWGKIRTHGETNLNG